MRHPASPSRSRVLTRGAIHIVDRRRLFWRSVAMAVLLVLLAFALGIWLGQRMAERSQPRFETESHSTDPLAEQFTLGRLGELSSRLQVLEKDADYLTRMVGAHEEIARRLSTVQPELKVSAPAAKPGASLDGEGGAWLPPRPCVPGVKVVSLARTEQGITCLRGLFDRMLDQVASRDAQFMAIPTLRPLATARLGSPFGNRADPFNHRLAFHSGQDFAAPSGTRIHAAAGGLVLSAGPYSSYGNMVVIDHGNGLVTRYAHCSKVLVKAGAVVLPGQEIAAVGTTGRSTGPHLHFEVLYRGEFVNPQGFLALGDMEPAEDGMAAD